MRMTASSGQALTASRISALRFAFRQMAAIAELDVGRAGKLLVHHKGHGVCLAVEMGHPFGETIAEEDQIKRGRLCLRHERGH